MEHSFRPAGEQRLFPPRPLVDGREGGSFLRTKVFPANGRRRAEYQVATEFWSDGEEKYVVKRAGDPAIAFLRTIETREQAAEAFFGGTAATVGGVRSGNCLVYDFVAGESLEARISRALDEGSCDAGLEWIAEYAAFLEALPTMVVEPIEFFRYLGVKNPRKEGGECICFSAGPVDLIPSNIIVSPDGWRVCDNEFFLDFPIPVDLVRYRGYATLASRVQAQIVKGKDRWGLVPFSGGGRTTIYIPAPWGTIWQRTRTSLRDLANWSWRFEATILTRSAPSYLRTQMLRLNGETESLPRSLTRWGNWMVAQAKYKLMNALA